jgi:fructosamine-3-kinase
VHIQNLHDYFADQLNADPTGGLSASQWLMVPAQTLRELTGGQVFHDGTGLLDEYRGTLAWYPDDVWRYVLACQWKRLAQEEAFVGRCGEVDDEVGSAVVAARQVRDLMKLCLLMDRVYPPYSKWLGTAFAALPSAAALTPVFADTLCARTWKVRERHLSSAYEIAAALHNGLGLAEPLDPTPRLYFSRPFQVLGADRFAEALLATISDPAVRDLPPVGAIDQYVDSTDLIDRNYADRRRRYISGPGLGEGPMARSVAATVEKLGLTELAPVGAGLEFHVWRARHPAWGEVALRASRRRFESNDNDPSVDTGALLAREAGLSRLLADAGLPVARHFEIVEGEVDVAVSEFISTDGTGSDSFELGAFAARLHSLGADDGVEPQHPDVFRTTIAERLSRRWAVLRDIEPELPKLPAPAELASVIPADYQPALLHLDLRASNLLVREGRIRAVIDWSNSLVGDPALELARTAEYARLPENGLDYPEFARGYASVRPIPPCADECWELYRLDTAAMLAVVFNREAPDPERGGKMLDRLVRRALEAREKAGPPG